MIDKPQDDWGAGKVEHLRLSQAVAEKYDEVYEASTFATGSYMRFELETIARACLQAPSSSIAVDLGCGTGRDAFALARHFDQVYGYDFSSEMVRIATRNKLRRRAGNTGFDVLDVETDRLPLDDMGTGLVNSGFGLGSFLNNLEPVFREVRRVLLPRGIAIFSFYNSDALVNALNLEWKPALAARAIPGRDRLHVEFEDQAYDISARAYSVRDIRHRLEGNFRILELLTFPTLTALFPQSLFASDKARALCTKVDQLLAANLDIAAGPYIVAVCQKGGEAPREGARLGYERVLELLRHHGVEADFRAHGPVRNMAEVRAVLEAPPQEMTKSVLVAIDPKEARTDGDPRAELYLVAIPADRRLDVGSLARLLDKKREQVRFATQVEVEDLTGFEVGSIPPFGLPKNIPVIVDSALAGLKRVWCGTGKSTESLHISIDDLRKLSTFSVADVSKPDRGDG